ncbi:fatty acid-binding protein homolog 5-like [Watersipora subatra]|uniref:fatty acid-binding protein homolog 5-like n=1 Tax=Watersipora subatra TaxID=2589382 RepID=UPI00355BEA4B
MSANEEAVNSCKLIVGTWKCDAAKSENFEEMLSHVGVNIVSRKLAVKGSPKMTLSIAEDNSSLNMVHEGIITSKTISYPFDGTPVDDESPGGHKSKSHFELRDGKPAIVTEPVDANHKSAIISR